MRLLPLAVAAVLATLASCHTSSRLYVPSIEGRIAIAQQPDDSEVGYLIQEALTAHGFESFLVPDETYAPADGLVLRYRVARGGLLTPFFGLWDVKLILVGADREEGGRPGLGRSDRFRFLGSFATTMVREAVRSLVAGKDPS